MTNINFRTTSLTRQRLQAYAAEKNFSMDEAIEDLLGSGLALFESQGTYAQLFSKGELRQALQAYYD